MFPVAENDTIVYIDIYIYISKSVHIHMVYFPEPIIKIVS